MEKRFSINNHLVSPWVFVAEHPTNPNYVIVVNGTITKCIEKSEWELFFNDIDEAYKKVAKKLRGEAEFIEREFLKIQQPSTAGSNEFVQKIVNAILDFRQSQQPIDVDMYDWNENCFEIHYKYSDGRWIFSRISEGLTEMVNDKDYQVSETELFTI